MNTILPLLQACDPVEVRASSVHSLLPLFAKFPQLMSERDYDDCNDEWRNLPYCLQRVKNTDDPSEFWCSVRKLKQADGTLVFLKLSKFMLNLLVLSPSSAAVERIFFTS